MILEHTGGELHLRAELRGLAQDVALAAATTPAGQTVLLGDAGWDPATLTLRLRVNSETAATPGDAAWEACEQVLQAAKGALSLRDDGDPRDVRTTYLHGLKSARRRPRGTWWELELTFLPRALDGVDGTGETITLEGEALTVDGRPLTIEVHHG